MTVGVSNIQSVPASLYDEANAILTPLETDGSATVNLVEVIRVSFESLAANKMRSALTMLGVIIGVSSMVTLMALGAGVQSAVTGQLQSMGTNLVSVVPGSASNRGPGGFGTAQTLTIDDVQAISNLGLPLNGIAPLFSGTTDVVAPAADKYIQIVGTTPAYFALEDLHPTNGSLFNEEQARSAAPVAVLGTNVAKDLFGSGTAVGQTIRVNDQVLRVVGVLERKGGIFATDDEIYAPIKVVQERLFSARTPDGNSYLVNVITMSAKNASDVDAIQNRIATLLRSRHHLKADGSTDDFTVSSMTSFLSTLNMISAVLTTFLAAIAGISLLVGGIGIMNIMLVSVTERTHEIGLRKAVGARNRDILLQFLVEAVVISLMGGLIGLGLGALFALLVSLSGILNATISVSSVTVALGFSTAVGLFFGIHPARRASKLNPIDALRYE